MVDIQSEVVSESIRRLMNECLEEVDESRLVKLDPVQMLVDPDLIRRLAALNMAMTRIINSIGTN